MSAQIIDVTDGVLTLKITGKLKQTELAAAQKQTAEIMDKQGKMRILVITENFLGWEKEGDWGDVSFSWYYDASMEKMAIVADKKWETLAVAFTAKGIRKFPIEFFEPADMDKARAWLAEGGAETAK